MEAKVNLRSGLTQHVISLQQGTLETPYSIIHRLKLAQGYKDLGYPDLAIGDAYKALILVDEVAEEGEYHDEAFEAAQMDFLEYEVRELSTDTIHTETTCRNDKIVAWAQGFCSRTAYNILIECLMDCGNLRSAFEYLNRAKKKFPKDEIFERHDQTLSKLLQSHFEAEAETSSSADIDEYPDKGLVRREQYPWNDHEPNRFSEQCLQFLNEELTRIAPKLEVKAVELPLLTTTLTERESNTEIAYTKQLGLFATEDIAPGETALEEKSLLTAVARLHDSYCDACSVPLPHSLGQSSTEDAPENIISCEECDEVFFCSRDCHDLAQESYHPSICGVDRDENKVPASEASDFLYSRLLVRALALAETQDISPLELKEVRYIWGDYHGLNLDAIWHNPKSAENTNAFGTVPRTLPFSFKYNILIPQNILEKMDVNIFTQSHRYDTWIFNVLYAKFRGTASARQGLDRRPEISAVHPMWCLANHSCDPNIAWDWQGAMRLWAREELVDWKGRNPDTGAGLRKGEEVRSHYCDIRLPVKERREWAVGALGGDCMCVRCVWEEAEARRVEVIAQ